MCLVRIVFNLDYHTAITQNKMSSTVRALGHGKEIILSPFFSSAAKRDRMASDGLSFPSFLSNLG